MSSVLSVPIFCSIKWSNSLIACWVVTDRISMSLMGWTVDLAIGTPEDGRIQKHMAWPIVWATPIHLPK
jgi:hypothetical protein